jgi:hypothetical protein
LNALQRSLEKFRSLSKDPHATVGDLHSADESIKSLVRELRSHSGVEPGVYERAIFLGARGTDTCIVTSVTLLAKATSADQAIVVEYSVENDGKRQKMKPMPLVEFLKPIPEFLRELRPDELPARAATSDA